MEATLETVGAAQSRGIAAAQTTTPETARLPNAAEGYAGGRGDGDTEPQRPARSLSMLLNSITLVAGKVASMGLGFLFWLLAARLYAPAEIGLAAGAVSAMMLCTQIALLGVGSAFILRFPHHRRRPAPLLDSALTVVSLTSLVTGALFLLLASGAFRELAVVGRDPVFAIAFLAACVLGTVGILLDQADTALRRGDQMLVRNVAFGVAALIALVALAVGAGRSGALLVFAPWVLAGGTALALGLRQLRRALGRYRFRPALHRSSSRQLLGAGLPNWALTLTERAPGLILPIVVIEQLSPQANAYWYAVWMMAWVVYIVPIQVGMNLFAELARRPERLQPMVVHGIKTSLALGALGAVAVAIAAELVLGLLGPGYADEGATPLRILVVAVVPLTLVHGYFAACRATGRLREATVTGALAGAVAVLAAGAVSTSLGLEGMAVAWVAAQTLAGAWGLWRLRGLSAGSGLAADSSLPLAADKAAAT